MTRSILAEVARQYVESDRRRQQHSDRGDRDAADAYLAELQLMERGIKVIETDSSWRRTIEARKKRERAGR